MISMVIFLEVLMEFLIVFVKNQKQKFNLKAFMIEIIKVIIIFATNLQEVEPASASIVLDVRGPVFVCIHFKAQVPALLLDACVLL
jgi:hypothetical protein